MPTNHPARSIEIGGGEIRRVLIALDSLQDIMSVEVASEIAALLRCSLQGLFVEDVELLRLAQLPFAHEVSLNPTNIRRMEALQLERELRAQAELARRLIAAQAEQHRIAWSFHIERGALNRVLAGRSELDIVLLGRRQLSPHSAERLLRGDTVLALFDGSEPARRALLTAAHVAGRATPLLVVLPAGRADLRGQAAQLLVPTGCQIHYLSLSEFSPAQFLAAGRRYHCRLMVVGGTPERLMPLLQNASCPVALVH